MPRSQDQCLSELCDLAKSGEAAWEARVQEIVGDYLDQFSGEAAAGRLELSDRFAVLAPDRERSARIREMILSGSQQTG